MNSLNTILCCLGKYDPQFINLTWDVLISTGFSKAFTELHVSLHKKIKEILKGCSKILKDLQLVNNTSGIECTSICFKCHISARSQP